MGAAPVRGGGQAQDPRGASPGGFGDRLADLVARRGSQIVLGLDPDPARLWPAALEPAAAHRAAGPVAAAAHEPDRGPAVAAARAVAAHCRLVLDAVAEQCVAVKPQVACFERLGAPGWAALAEVARDAAERGLLVIADAKRGDIDISARAYAQAYFGHTPTPFGDVPGLGADALTVNPLLGADTLAPVIEAARAHGAGVLALVRTSNPGAADVQDLPLSGGGTVSAALAEMVDRLGRPGVGASGLSDVGAVTGATVPQRLAALRARMPSAVLLLPGIGPQGGDGRGLEAAFAPGPAGGLVSASRAIVDAHLAATPATGSARRSGDAEHRQPGRHARDAAARLRALVWDLYA